MTWPPERSSCCREDVIKEDAIGRIFQTWDLIADSFAILKADRQLLWLPVLSGIFCVLASVIVMGGSSLLFLPLADVNAALHRHSMSQGMWVGLFLFYLANYFVIVFFNVALVSVADSRLAGGHATINDGLEVAWQRKGKIFQWALFSATVGIVLRMIQDRSAWLGRLVAGLVGVGWTLASYFVLPLLAAEDVGPAEALQRSAEMFRETWGEQVAGGFSFGLIFTLLALPGIALPVVGRNFGPTGIAARSRVRARLLAVALRGRRRCAGHIPGGSLSICQDQAGLGWLPPGKLFDRLAAEELVDRRSYQQLSQGWQAPLSFLFFRK